MSERPYVLAETNWKSVREWNCEVAVLPWGATEAHNLHLPYGTDTTHATWVACEAARLASERNARVVVLPAVPYGVNTTQLDIALTINMSPTTQMAVLHDVVESLETQGIGKLVILNGHGGNDFKWMIRELMPATSTFICAVNWWQVIDPSREFADPGDHAGQLETSVMLHIAPDQVRPIGEAGSGHAKQPRIEALREGWAWAPRPWTQVTADTGIGNPAGASTGKGERFATAAAEKIAGFLVELASADIGSLYE